MAIAGILKFLFLLCILVFSAEAKAEEPLYYSMCALFNKNFDYIKRVPGDYCYFLNDGSFISATEEGQTSYYSHDGIALWKKKIHSHHQLKINSQEQFLLLTSEIHKFDGDDTRFDSFLVVDKSGEIIKKWRFFDHQRELNRLFGKDIFLETKRTWSNHWFPKAFNNVKHEASHLNSAYEIPNNDYEDKIPGFKKGNYVLNSSSGFVFILDAELNKILWFEKYGKIFPSLRLHDVQILKNGHFLVFNNYSASNAKISNIYEAKGPLNKQSLLQEIDPLSGKVVWQYGLKREQAFFSRCCGGVQLLANDQILFVDLEGVDFGVPFKEARIVVIDREGKKLIDKPLLVDGKPIKPQEIKLLDQIEFLKFSKSPI